MDDEVSDANLIAAVLSGDSARFDELARRYWSPLWRTARSRLGRDDAADDAVQETLLSAYRWLRTYDSRYSFRTWLWTILLNYCRRSFGKAARRDELLPEDQEAAARLARFAGRELEPIEYALLKERADSLERLLARLPEPQADALRLRFHGDLKFQEIADVMQCCLSTAKIRVRDGLQQLTLWLVEDDARDSLAAQSAPSESHDADLPANERGLS